MGPGDGGNALKLFARSGNHDYIRLLHALFGGRSEFDRPTQNPPGLIHHVRLPVIDNYWSSATQKRMCQPQPAVNLHLIPAGPVRET